MDSYAPRRRGTMRLFRWLRGRPEASPSLTAVSTAGTSSQAPGRVGAPKLKDSGFVRIREAEAFAPLVD